MLDRSSPGAGAIPEWTGRPSARLPDGLENCPKSRSAVRRVDQAAASRTLPSLRSCCCPPVHQLHFARLQAHRQIVACFLAPTRAGRGRGRVGQQHHRSAGGNSVAGHDPGHTVAGVEHLRNWTIRWLLRPSAPAPHAYAAPQSCPTWSLHISCWAPSRWDSPSSSKRPCPSWGWVFRRISRPGAPC